LTGPSADWAVLLYGDNNTPSDWSLVSNEARMLGVRVVMIQGHVPREDVNERFHPKHMFQQQLVSLSFDYDYVWLLDEDISLANFQWDTFFRWHHLSFPPPIIAQPLIARNSQNKKFLVSMDQWEGHSYIAAEVTFVEQQAPLMDAGFFRFFVNCSRELIVKQRQMGSDWGADEVWCGAAFLYSRDYLKEPLRTACAIIMTPITHDNTKEKSKRFMSSGFKLLKWAHSSGATFWIRAFVHEHHRLRYVVSCHASGGFLEDSGTGYRCTSIFFCWGHSQYRKLKSLPAFSCRSNCTFKVPRPGQTFGYLVSQATDPSEPPAAKLATLRNLKNAQR